MLTWFKTLRAIVRNYFADIERLKAKLALLEGHIATTDQIIRERTDIAVDVSFSRKDMNTVIVVGRFRGCDYVQTYHLQADDLVELIDRLRNMERYGVVRRIDAPPHMVGAIKRDLHF